MACETATKTNMVMIFGEITTSAKVDYEKVVRETCRAVGFTSDDVGLDCDKCKVWQPFATTWVYFAGLQRLYVLQPRRRHVLWDNMLPLLAQADVILRSCIKPVCWPAAASSVLQCCK